MLTIGRGLGLCIGLVTEEDIDRWLIQRKEIKSGECIVNNEVPCLHEEARERVRMEEFIY